MCFGNSKGQSELDHSTNKLKPVVAGTLSSAEYDKHVADLVGFLVWAGEPGAGFRRQIGLGVLAFFDRALWRFLRAEKGVLEGYQVDRVSLRPRDRLKC